MDASSDGWAPPPTVFSANCPSRSLLEHLTSKWGVLVVVALCPGPLRWSELRHRIDGVSEKMLAQVLRILADDGLISRTQAPAMPPHVTYALTDAGREAASLLLPLLEWIGDRAAPVPDARVAAP